MNERPDNPVTHNKAQFQQLTTLLEDPKGPVFCIIQYDTFLTRSNYVEEALALVENGQPIVLELAPTQVVSLADVLEEKLGDTTFQADLLADVVCVINLEASIVGEMFVHERHLMQHLAEEAGKLTQSIAPVVLLWLTEYTSGIIREQVPALWESATARLSFWGDEDTTAIPEGDDKPSLIKRAAFYRENGMLTRESRTWKELLTLCEETDDKTLLSEIYASIGRILFNYERVDHAMEYAAKALENREEAATPGGVGKALFLQGFGEINEGNTAEGILQIEEALDLFELGKDFEELGKGHQTMGQMYFQGGDVPKAIVHFELAIGAFTEINDHERIGKCHQVLAIFEEQRGKLDAAANRHRLAVASFEKVEDHAEMARSWQQAGAIEQNQFNWEKALEAFQAALPHAKKTDNEFLVNSLEDSIEDMTKKAGSQKKDGSKGIFGKLFG